MELEILQTPRLDIYVVTPERYQQIHNSYSDDQLMQLFGISTQEALAEEKEHFRLGSTTYKISFVYFMLRLKSEHKTIGWIGFHTWYTKHDRAEVGYHLVGDEYKRKGLMTEALGAVLTYGFEQMNLYRVEALAADYNEPSIRLLTNFGFQYEGRLRGHYLVEGRYEDSVMYSLLRREFVKPV